MVTRYKRATGWEPRDIRVFYSNPILNSPLDSCHWISPRLGILAWKRTMYNKNDKRYDDARDNFIDYEPTSYVSPNLDGVGCIRSDAIVGCMNATKCGLMPTP
ncbi:MAG: hypothetical protein AAGC64_07600 [Bacteroidota bacterium]